MTDPRDYPIRTQDPDTQPINLGGAGERQRAAIALGILAIVALIVVGIMVAVLGRGGGSGKPAAQSVGGPSGPAVTVTGGQQPSTHSRSTGTQRAHRTHPVRSKHPHQPPARPNGAPVSCPSSAPCALSDDVGHAISALNAFRTSHGKPAVRGAVTRAARTCAVSSGNQCPNGFYWEPVGRSGQQVIQKIVAAGGTSWLLDSRMSAAQVGWAYLPASHSFECALVSNAP